MNSAATEPLPSEQDAELDEGRLPEAPLQRRGFSCVAGPNQFKVRSPRGQRSGDFLMQKQTLLFEVVCGVITIGVMFSLMSRKPW